MSDEVKVLFGNIMQPFKSAFGTGEKKDEEKKGEKKEYSMVSLIIMYIVFIISFIGPWLYLYVYLPNYAEKKVSSAEVLAAIKNGTGDALIYRMLIAFSILFGLVGLISTAATTKVKDDSKGDKATFSADEATGGKKKKSWWSKEAREQRKKDKEAKKAAKKAAKEAAASSA